MRIGEYELEGELGRGAMGTVYLGRGPKGELVAVKVLARVDAASRDRFRHEATAMRRVTHPSIVRIREVGELASGPYIVTDYLEGGSLLQVLTVHGAQSPGATARVLCDLAEALTALHTAGVIHRDVKPSNVVLSRDGAPLLADLGVASVAGESCLTATGEVIGTLGYTAPEVLDGAPATPASDTFGLGVLGYHLLTGRPPFAGSTPAAVIKACATNQYPPLASVRFGVPAALDHAIATAMAPDPAGRPTDLRLWAHHVRSQVHLESVPTVAAEALLGGITETRVRQRILAAPPSPDGSEQAPKRRLTRTAARRLAIAVVGVVLLTAAVAWALMGVPAPDGTGTTDTAVASDGTGAALPDVPTWGTVIQAPTTTPSADTGGDPAPGATTAPPAGAAPAGAQTQTETQTQASGPEASPSGGSPARGATAQPPPPTPTTRPPPPTTAAKPLHPADFNGDSRIDSQDLRQLCDQYGRTGSGLPWDLNGNAAVDIYDLSILLSNWTGPSDSSEQPCN